MIDILAISQASFTPINREIYRRLAATGFSLELVVPTQVRFPSGEKIAFPREENDPPIHFLELKGANNRVQTYEGIFELLLSRRPRIIFIDFDPASYLAVQMGRWSRKHNSKLVCISVENFPLNIFDNLKRLGIKALIPAVVKNLFVLAGRKNIAHVFTISNDCQKIFQGLKYKSVSKTPVGFDEKIFNYFPEKRKKIRRELSLDDKIVIAYFGQTRKDKGIHILLHAVKLIEHLQWFLIMDDFGIYKTEYSKTIDQLIDELELRDRIKFVHPDHVEIAAYMNASDIVVVPSISSRTNKEQYGRIIPEAMACKSSVIVSTSGTLPELVDDCGEVIPENDAQALADKLEEMIGSDHLIEKYRQMGYTRSQNYLGIATQLKLYKEVFDKLLGHNQ